MLLGHLYKANGKALGEESKRFGQRQTQNERFRRSFFCIYGFPAPHAHNPAVPCYLLRPAVLRELYSYNRISHGWSKKWPFKNSRTVARVVSELSKTCFPPDVILSLVFHDKSPYLHIYEVSLFLSGLRLNLLGSQSFQSTLTLIYLAPSWPVTAPT